MGDLHGSTSRMAGNGLLAMQHRVMARPGLGRWWMRIVPSSVERGTYVLSASIALLPIPTPVWTVDNPAVAGAVDAINWLGWVVLVASALFLDYFGLFGLAQVFMRLFGKQRPDAKLRTPLLYRYVLHPIYLGILLAVWATPEMSADHLLFALVITACILIDIQLEEHNPIRQFGHRYRARPASRPKVRRSEDADV